MTEQQPDNASADAVTARLQEATSVEIARATREGTRLVMQMYGKRRYQAKFDTATDEYIAALEAELAATRTQLAAATGDIAEGVRLMKDLQWNHAQGIMNDVENDHDVYVYLAEHGAFEPTPFLIDDEAATPPAGAEEDAR